MAGISAQGRTVMAALEAGRAMTRMGADWRSGLLVATAAVVAELVRHDLVRVDGDALVLSGAGQGYAARAEGAPNRLIGTRVVDRRRLAANMAESPLGWLKARGLVSERQHMAGERLRADWTTAQLAPSVTMRWDAGPTTRGARGPGRALDPTMGQIAAKRRFEAAVAAAGGGLSDILWRVVCAGEGLETAEKALGWPKRAGKLVLTMALDRIADHYAM